MLTRLLKKEFRKNKAINITVFLFILLSALLVSSAAGIIHTLTGSVNHLFETGKTPHFVQSHVGEFNQKEIDEFAKKSNLVKEQQTAEMINIDGSKLYIADENFAEAESSMDVSFVTQNKNFDYITGLDDKVVSVNKGEIAVPLYYMQQKNLKIGDKVWLKTSEFEKEFKITQFSRDAQMNPSLISSKRFVINQSDFNEVQQYFKEKEYLIEFILNDKGDASQFADEYINAGLPAAGYTVDHTILSLFNALSDGMAAAIIIVISLLLMGIAILCLRFTLLSTIEEEFREIGVMKAIGMRLKDIRRLYMIKYTAISIAACTLGYILSIFLSNMFTANITLYMGKEPTSIISYIIPVIGSLLIFGLVLLACRIILRKFGKISAVEAIRSGRLANSGKAHTKIKISNSKFSNMNIFIGIRDIAVRLKSYLLLIFVFITCTFIMIMPFNIMNTMKSPDFISYMGAPKCDIRIDLQKTDDVTARYENMIDKLSNDKEIKKFSPLITCNYKIKGSDGLYENISVESGDFDIFPLEYAEGRAPKKDNEIALSYLQAKEMEKTVGDTVIIQYKGSPKKLTVCGIYQDITNGGKTAKSSIKYDPESVLWYTANVDVNDGIDINNKVASLSHELSPAKVTDTSTYLNQTLGVLRGIDSCQK